jgi:putrescine transport system ATP-binding protein
MDLQVRLGTTFIVVTHDQEEAMTMADRIGVMDRGRLEQVATPGELYEQPRTRFIAEFVGDTNIFAGTVTGGEGGRWQVATRSAPAPLVVEDRDVSLQAGQTVAVAVRPEKMQLHREPPAEATNLLSGQVWDIGYLGDWTVYRVKLNSGAAVRASSANVSRFVEAPVTWDEPVYLSFAPDAAVILTR